MQRILLLLSLIIASPLGAIAADWEDLKKNAAKIEVLNMQPVPFVVSTEKSGWAAIPPQLDKPDTRVFMPVSGTNPVSDIKVIEDGWIIVACNYGYQGNASGNWETEV